MPKNARLRTLKLVSLAREATKESMEKLSGMVWLGIANPLKSQTFAGLSPIILSPVTKFSWHVMLTCTEDKEQKSMVWSFQISNCFGFERIAVDEYQEHRNSTHNRKAKKTTPPHWNHPSLVNASWCQQITEWEPLITCHLIIHRSRKNVISET